MTKPFSPEEAKNSKDGSIPDFVIEAVNTLLSEKYSDCCIYIHQSKLVDLIIKNNPTVSSSDLYKHQWLDFENLYRKQGWRVSYDRPGYNEDYDPVWEFTQR